MLTGSFAACQNFFLLLSMGGGDRTQKPWFELVKQNKNINNSQYTYLIK